MRALGTHVCGLSLCAQLIVYARRPEVGWDGWYVYRLHTHRQGQCSPGSWGGVCSVHPNHIGEEEECQHRRESFFTLSFGERDFSIQSKKDHTVFFSDVSWSVYQPDPNWGYFTDQFATSLHRWIHAGSRHFQRDFPILPCHFEAIEAEAVRPSRNGGSSYRSCSSCLMYVCPQVEIWVLSTFTHLRRLSCMFWKSFQNHSSWRWFQILETGMWIHMYPTYCYVYIHPV